MQEEEEDNFPEILKMFVNQKYTIRLQIGEDNLKKESTVYNAKEVVQKLEISDNFGDDKQTCVEQEDDSGKKVQPKSLK